MGNSHFTSKASRNTKHACRRKFTEREKEIEKKDEDIYKSCVMQAVGKCQEETLEMVNNNQSKCKLQN